MKPNHPGDEAIQQYVLGEEGGADSIASHINTCESCKARVAVYRLLFAEIAGQPKPLFGFDATRLVLAQLPAPAFNWGRFWNYAAIVSVTVLVMAPLYYFSKYFLNILNGMSSFFVCAIAFASVAIMLHRVLKMYRDYQKQINELNFY